MLEHICDVLGANLCQYDVNNFSNLLKIARFSWLASARKRTHVLTVCQQQRWQVLEHCANSRVRASVGTLSVLTVDVGVPTLERTPCVSAIRRHDFRAAGECLSVGQGPSSQG